MFENFLDPVVLCFALGLVAHFLRVPLSIPAVVYETIAIYLLLAIGLKGGHELAQVGGGSVLLPAFGALFIGIVVPTIAFFIATKMGRFSREEAVALAAHYGAASAVTFAVALNYVEDSGLVYEGYLTILLAIVEVTGILIAFSYLHFEKNNWRATLKKIFHDVLLNKSIFLMLAGVFMGAIASASGFKHVQILFIDLFKGILCFFMLEMGLVCAEQVASIKERKAFILGFGLVMPFLGGTLGLLIGKASGLSLAGATALAAISASASYIAAPVATRLILPQVNLSLPLACSLGVTFPFNILVGIPLYFFLASRLY